MVITDTTNLAVATRENVTDGHGVPGNPWDDATWILTSSFIIFTMQSGFGLLESGLSSKKDEVNIMVKNIVDVVFGGITYWMLGYGFSFGTEYSTNFFCGVGSFFLDPDEENMGTEFSQFIFQASFATTSTTIVSGAMAGRTKLMAYIIFSSVNTFIYCFPAHWVWAENGWLRKLDVVDIAGDGPVHLVGGVTALVAAIMLGPRKGRFDDKEKIYTMSSPTSALLGMFILWWGWLGFNCGSTFGISGGKWKLASRAATTTILSTCGGGITALTLSYILTNRKFVDVGFIINGILGALVSITGTCAVTTTWEAIVIGSIGALVSCFGEKLLHKLKVDDPVGAVPVHCFCAAWGLIAAGIFAHEDTIVNSFSKYNGLVRGGSFYLLGVQTLAVVSLAAWSATTSCIVLKILQLTIGIRCSPEEEIMGADYCEHRVIHQDLDERAMVLILKREREKNKRKTASIRRLSIVTGRVNESVNVELDVTQTEELSPTTRHVHFTNNNEDGPKRQSVSNGVIRKSSLPVNIAIIDSYEGAYETDRFDKYNSMQGGRVMSSEVTKL